jgi:hypothetical protein
MHEAEKLQISSPAIAKHVTFSRPLVASNATRVTQVGSDCFFVATPVHLDQICQVYIADTTFWKQAQSDSRQLATFFFYYAAFSRNVDCGFSWMIRLSRKRLLHLDLNLQIV